MGIEDWGKTKKLLLFYTIIFVKLNMGYIYIFYGKKITLSKLSVEELGSPLVKISSDIHFSITIYSFTIQLHIIDTSFFLYS